MPFVMPALSKVIYMLRKKFFTAGKHSDPVTRETQSLYRRRDFGLVRVQDLTRTCNACPVGAIPVHLNGGHGTASDIEETHGGDSKTEKERGFEEVERRRGAEEAEEKKREVGEKTTTATRAYTNPRSRESANREPNGKPLTDSKVRRQSGRFSCLRNPELFGRVFQSAFANTLLARSAISSLTDTTTVSKCLREFDSTAEIESDRFARETIRLPDLARTTGLATAVNVGFPTLCCVDRTTPRENQPPVPLSSETKGNARSSLIRTIDLLRREYCDCGGFTGVARSREEGDYPTDRREPFSCAPPSRATRVIAIPMSFSRTKDNFCLAFRK
ncbi:hypothetical protein DBV15_11387 [Temnothorax longispinosus]|uniref:Uncharacterized protein n=1 Tax=Temnothorax longispinosus TaxID=300112 RepID=A0A4S2KGK4_9HYME|nr:hypothetical protein DBV15_11387 [Temnothorax longispinosus]